MNGAPDERRARMSTAARRAGAMFVARPRLRFWVFFLIALAVLLIVPALIRSRSTAPPPLAPAFPAGATWVNAGGAAPSLESLRGKVVALWFWRASDAHSLSSIFALERLISTVDPGEVAVVGVHVPKFPGEASAETVARAAQRLLLTFLVLSDDSGETARAYGVDAWPAFAVIDPDGVICAEGQGGVTFEDLRDAAAEAWRRTGGGELGPRAPGIRVAPADSQSPVGVIARPPSGDDPGFLAIAMPDQVSIRTYPNELGETAELWSFEGVEPRALRRPRGMAYDPASRVLYIANESLHEVIGVDLRSREVSLVAGRAEAASRRARPGEVIDAIPSPRGLAVAPDGSRVYVTSASLNQVLAFEPKFGGKIEVIAGSGRANVIDGPLDAAAFAQPSGLTISADGKRLYVTDADGSAVRLVDLEAGVVTTLAGAPAEKPWLDALFEFGCADGPVPDSRLQHPLGLAVMDEATGTRLLVGDTLNGLLREIEVGSRLIGPTTLPAPPGGPIEPSGVWATPDGRVFVADQRNDRVLMWNGAAWVEIH